MTKEKNAFMDTFDAIVVAFVIAIIIRALFIQAYRIPSGSMLETLQIGDNLLVEKVTYKFSDPKVDDIIVFEFPLEPDKDYIKRVVGVPGDKLKLVNKVLYRNGIEVKSDFTKFTTSTSLPASISPRDNMAEITVPEGSYFVMGDNRDNSFDSRFWGLVSRDAVVGKALIIYWSWNSDSAFKVRFDRIFNLI